MKKILGIQKDHNSAACLFYDDELAYYNQEERLSRIKKDSGLPFETLKKICKISNEIDVLLISGYDNFQSENYSIISIIKKLGFKFSPDFKFVPYYKSHHLVHAAKAFYGSGFENALVFVQDGRGSYYNLNNGGIAFESTSVFHAAYPDNFSLVYKRLFTHSPVDNDTRVVWDNNFTEDSIDRPRYLRRDSIIKIRNDFDLGFMYEGTSRSMGFDDEGGKLLGLQSYGKYSDALPKILDENFVFNMNIFKFNEKNQHQGFNRTDFLELSAFDTCVNFSFMVQKSFEKAGLKLIEDMLSQTKHKNLILTGGTALNVVANNFYRQSLDKDINLYIEPICGDEGNCIGICQHYYASTAKSKKVKESISIYVCGQDPVYEFSLENNETEIIDTTGELVTELLMTGHIVGLFQGKSEAGPRALGNRSLLFDPRVINGKDIVNSIKLRESFRPFAAAVMLEHADSWFNLDKINESPHMMYAVDIKKDKNKLIPAVTHVDNSCRVQTVTSQQNQHLYNIIENFYNATSIPLLLNTSFNLAGDPMVETVQDAINSLRKSKLEYMYLPEIKKIIYIKN